MWDWGGTSAATPFVAGQIALFMERFGKVSQAEFQRLIRPSCMDLGNEGKDWIYGDGLIVLPDKIDDYNPYTFTDITGHYAEDAIVWGSDVGLVNGFPDNTFRPDQPVTRGQLLLILQRYTEQFL